MLTMEGDSTVHVNGVNICYNDSGNGHLPVIFIHGFPFDKFMWKPQVDFFKKTHRVITYDIRGFGNSSANDDKPSMSLFADDLVKLMDALQISKAVVCGLSMGGYIVLNAVNRYPERFEAIILCDTQCIADSAEGKEKRNQAIAHVIANGLNDFTEGFVKNIFYKTTFEVKAELVEEIKNKILTTPTFTITSTLSALAQRPEMCFSLSEISIPVLILCGREDTLTPLAQSEFMHQHIKGSILYSIEKAGHMSNLEQPDEFNKCTNNFFLGLLK